jgi:hypothetical protein
MEKIGEVPSVKNMQRDMNSLYNVGNRTPFLLGTVIALTIFLRLGLRKILLSVCESKN